MFVFALISSLFILNQAKAAEEHDHMIMHETNDAFAPAMTKMHEEMGAVRPTGDIDVDFVQGMIPHHQGAVDMAKIELEQGKDPEIKKFAADIIKAQEAEIKMMNTWLRKHKK